MSDKKKDKAKKKNSEGKASRRTLGGPELKMPSFLKRSKDEEPEGKKKSKDKKKSKGKASSSRRTLGGPELKMPSFVSSASMPKPVGNVVADLRQRGLLPIVLVLIVAIVAVPFLLSSSKEAPAPKSNTASSAQAAFATAPEAQPVVLQAGQGVREYKQRLDESAKKDPFVQQYQAPAADTGGGGGDTGTVTGSAADAAAAVGGGSSSGGETPSGGGGGGAQTKEPQFINFNLDAFVGEANHLKRKHNIERLDLLPSNKNAAAVYLGVSGSTDKALFSISSQVTAVKGDGHCVMESETCNLLVLEPGKSAKLDYAPKGKTYVIKLVRVNQVVSKSP
jgi:hypothetical protein